MGAKDLGKISVITETSLSRFSDRTVAIDALNWIIEFTKGVRWGMDTSRLKNSNGEQIDHLVGILRGIRRLFRLDLDPVFAFDRSGSGSLKTRHSNRSDNSDFWQDEPFRRDTTRKLLSLLDIPHVEGEMDGEAEAAALVQEGQADFVISNDFDTMLFGAPVTIQNFTGSDSERLLSLAGTLDTLNISHEQLVDIALASGTDYFEGIDGVGPKTAAEAISDGTSLQELGRTHGQKLPDLEPLRSYYLNPQTAEITGEIWSPQPDIQALNGFLDAVGFDDELRSSEISHLEKSLQDDMDTT
jgi:flap endonuclease-1